MEHQMQTVKKAVRNATLLVSVIFLLLGVVFWASVQDLASGSKLCMPDVPSRQLEQ